MNKNNKKIEEGLGAVVKKILGAPGRWRNRDPAPMSDEELEKSAAQEPGRTKKKLAAMQAAKERAARLDKHPEEENASTKYKGRSLSEDAPDDDAQRPGESLRDRVKRMRAEIKEKNLKSKRAGTRKPKKPSFEKPAHKTSGGENASTEYEGPSLAEVTAKSLIGKKPGRFAGKEKKQQFKSLKKRLTPGTEFMAGAGTVPAPSPHKKTVQTGSRNYPGVSSRRVHRTSDHTEYEGPSLSETKDWIQGAVKRPGRCTPMPNPDCPVGSPQYNLGKRFKKAGRKEKSEGGTGWEGKV